MKCVMLGAMHTLFLEHVDCDKYVATDLVHNSAWVHAPPLCHKPVLLNPAASDLHRLITLGTKERNMEVTNTEFPLSISTDLVLFTENECLQSSVSGSHKAPCVSVPGLQTLQSSMHAVLLDPRASLDACVPCPRSVPVNLCLPPERDAEYVHEA